VARLEAIRILLAFAVAKGFKLYQMDVKLMLTPMGSTATLDADEDGEPVDQ
jgi:hypothetical protein